MNIQPYQVLTLVLLLLSAAAYLEVKMYQAAKTKAAAPRPLSFDESYVLACLLQISTATIYGESIRRNLQELEDVNHLRQQIREVCQSLSEEPEVMRGILGDQAFEAVSEYLEKNPFLISNRPAVPGGGRS